MQSERYLGGSYRLPVFADQVACFYAGNDSMSACQQKSVADGWMTERRSRPKHRALCQRCLDWLVGEGLAECMPLQSDAMLSLHPPCKLPDAGRNLPLGTSPDAVPRIAAYGEDAAVGEHLSQPCTRVIDVSSAWTGITSSYWCDTPSVVRALCCFGSSCDCSRSTLTTHATEVRSLRIGVLLSLIHI